MTTPTPTPSRKRRVFEDGAADGAQPEHAGAAAQPAVVTAPSVTAVHVKRHRGETGDSVTRQPASPAEMSAEHVHPATDLMTAPALVDLAVRYADGTGVVKDDVEAVRLYRLAADKGYAPAQRLLAMCYGKGSGVTKDRAEAIRLYRLAVAQGDARAQGHLGVCYELGRGIPMDTDEAVRLYRLADDQGCANAQYNLAVCYRAGTGVVKDTNEAVRFYRLAADQGHAEAQCSLGLRYEYGMGVAKDEGEAARLFRLSADQGNATAQANLATCYDQALGVTKDTAEAVRLYRLAADQGNARAQSNIGLAYACGRGVTKDVAEAVRFCRLAADQMHSYALVTLSGYYDNGTGVTKDSVEAVRLVRLAADQGYARAQVLLGIRYLDGDGVEMNFKTARHWLRLGNAGPEQLARVPLVLRVYASGNATVGDDDAAAALMPRIPGVCDRAYLVLTYATRGDAVNLDCVLQSGGSVRVMASRVQSPRVGSPGFNDTPKDSGFFGDTPLHAAARGAHVACIAVMFALPEWDELLNVTNARGERPRDVVSSFAPSIRPFLSTSRRTRAACFVFCCKERERAAELAATESVSAPTCGSAAAAAAAAAADVQVPWFPREIVSLIARALLPPRKRRIEKHDARDLFPHVSRE